LCLLSQVEAKNRHSAHALRLDVQSGFPARSSAVADFSQAPQSDMAPGSFVLFCYDERLGLVSPDAILRGPPPEPFHGQPG